MDRCCCHIGGEESENQRASREGEYIHVYKVYWLVLDNIYIYISIYLHGSIITNNIDDDGRKGQNEGATQFHSPLGRFTSLDQMEIYYTFQAPSTTTTLSPRRRKKLYTAFPKRIIRPMGHARHFHDNGAPFDRGFQSSSPKNQNLVFFNILYALLCVVVRYLSYVYSKEQHAAEGSLFFYLARVKAIISRWRKLQFMDRRCV